MADAHLEVFQAEWCPHSSRVRQKLTELGVRYVAVPVPPDPVEREVMRRKTGTDEIPALLFEDGTVLKGDTDEILRDLEGRFSAGAFAEQHRRKAAEH